MHVLLTDACAVAWLAYVVDWLACVVDWLACVVDWLACVVDWLACVVDWLACVVDWLACVLQLAGLRVQLTELRGELEESVESENFSQAAHIKSQLKEVEMSRNLVLEQLKPQTVQVATAKVNDLLCNMYISE